MSVVLTAADQAASTVRQTVRPAPDPHFVGRRATVTALAAWARFGEPVTVRPMVLTGSIGVGKTSIALQFAAEHPHARVTVLDGASALNLAASAQDNLGLAPKGSPPAVPLTIPGGPFDLVIIDGVTDATVAAPYLSAQNSARVLVTSTATDLGRHCLAIQVDGWDDDDAVRFIHESHPRFEPAEARTLATALGHNPLAITQAVAVCQHLSLDLPSYLLRLEQAPEVVLDIGADPLRPRSLVAALRLSLDSLTERAADARAVLELLCCLGSIPIARDFVGSSAIVMFLDGSDEVRNPHPVDASMHLSKMLRTPGERDRALYRLATASLLRIVDDTIVVHPVVRQVVLALAADLRPPLEVGLGHFDTYLGLSEDSGRPDEATDTTRAAQVISLCFSSGHVGPASYGACLVFAPYLARLGEIDQALKLAEAGHAWTERRRRRIPPAHAVVEDLQHVQALVAAYQHSEAGHRLPRIFSTAQRLGLSRQASMALRLLAQVATSTEDPASWSFVADHLPSINELDAFPRATALDLLMTHAHVSWRAGDTARAQDAVDRVLAEVGSGASSTDGGWRVEALQFVSMLARFKPDGPGRSTAALARVHQMEWESGQAPLTNINYTHALLDAVDALIDDDDITQAEDLMALARSSMTGRLSGITHLVNSCASIEGRLALHQHQRDPGGPQARAHLERARRLLLEAVEGRRQEPAKRLLPATLINLSTVQHCLNLHSDAARSAGEACEIDLELFGPDHPESIEDIGWWMELRAIEAQARLRH